MTTNSVMNMIRSQSAQPVPEVGMGATRLQWTDRTACTITRVIYDRTGSAIGVEVREDICKRVDDNGFSESQEYTYESNRDGAQHTYTLRKNGAWVRLGEDSKRGERLQIGERASYHDYSF